MIPMLILTGILMLFPVFCRRQERKKKPEAGFGESMLRYLKRFSKYDAEGKKISAALLLSEEEEEKKRTGRLLISWGLLLIGSMAALIMLIGNGRREQILTLERPSFGTEKQVTLSVSGLQDGNEEELEITVTGKIPEQEEMEDVFREAFAEVCFEGLGENVSSDAVSVSLSLPSETESGIHCSYRSSDIDVITDQGTIVAEEIPDEGIPVMITVSLEFGDYASQKEWNLRVVPKAEKELTETEKIRKMISELDAETQDSDLLTLPEQMDGTELIFLESARPALPAAAFFAFLAVGVFFLPEEQKKEALKKRNAELERSLPNILSRLKTLIDAGLSIQSAWFRIAETYQREKKEKNKIYAYEEMVLTMQQIRGGITEREAYMDFGRRCGLHSYVKLGNLLAKNLRQGIAGLSDELEEEMVRAVEERKAQALRQGETAGTKLLLPMAVMLGVVVTVLVIPAFMSF